MTWTSSVMGVVVAAVLLVPLALKWQLPMRVVTVWVVAVGAVSGTVWGAVLGPEASLWVWAVAQSLTVVALSVAAAAAAFFRDPERVSPDTPGAILSPADGTVLYVRRFPAGATPPSEKHGRPLDLRELAGVDVGGNSYLVGIGMHLLNVHVNRAPIAGRATLLVHTPGRFVSLRREGATTMNERFTTVLDGESTRVVVVQIASRLVRRIVSYLAVDQDVSAGQRIGMIRFGSQVDVIVPDSEGLELRVVPGDLVKAGVTVMALIDQCEMDGE